MKWKTAIQILVPILTALAGGAAVTGTDFIDTGAVSRTKDTEQDRRLDRCDQVGTIIQEDLRTIHQDLGLIKGALGITR